MSRKKDHGRQGFTLAEMLIVVAIIAVLAALAIPAVSGSIEKARNAADVYTAKACANAIIYYFETNPEKQEALQAVCEKPGSVHCVQISVGSKDASINTLLAPALYEAGLIQKVGNSATRYSELTCQSRQKWIAYYVLVRMDDDGLHVGYIAFTDRPKGAHVACNWGDISQNKDKTGFAAIMRGQSQ